MGFRGRAREKGQDISTAFCHKTKHVPLGDPCLVAQSWAVALQIFSSYPTTVPAHLQSPLWCPWVTLVCVSVPRPPSGSSSPRAVSMPRVAWPRADGSRHFGADCLVKATNKTCDWALSYILRGWVRCDKKSSNNPQLWVHVSLAAAVHPHTGWGSLPKLLTL